MITVEAKYESGVLKLSEPLPLDEHETVRVTVQTDRVRQTGRADVTPPRDGTPNEPASAPAADLSSTTEPPSELADWEMLDIRLDVPPSPNARTVVARRGPLPLPDPPVIPPDDDELE